MLGVFSFFSLCFSACADFPIVSGLLICCQHAGHDTKSLLVFSLQISSAIRRGSLPSLPSQEFALPSFKSWANGITQPSRLEVIQSPPSFRPEVPLPTINSPSLWPSFKSWANDTAQPPRLEVIGWNSLFLSLDGFPFPSHFFFPFPSPNFPFPLLSNFPFPFPP